MEKTCITCGSLYSDLSSTGWSKKCLLCWKTEQKYSWTKADHALKRMQDLYTEAFKELTALKDPTHQLGIEFDGLTEARIKSLLKLCHPDKHKGSSESEAITKWLLRLKESPKRVDSDWASRILPVLEDRHFVSWEDLEVASEAKERGFNLEDRQDEIHKLFSVAGFTYGRAVDLDGVKKVGFWHVQRTKDLRAKYGV